MADSIPPNTSSSQSENNDNVNDRSRSQSRKPPLSNSDEQMKPQSTRQRSLSVSRKPVVKKDQITFKTQDQTFDMKELVQTTFLKPEVFDNVLSKVMSHLKNDLLSEFTKSMKSVVTQAVENAVKPLNELIRKQEQRIVNLEAENQSLRTQYDKKIESVEARYEKFRNIANAHATLLSKNQQLTTEIDLLH